MNGENFNRQVQAFKNGIDKAFAGGVGCTRELRMQIKKWWLWLLATSGTYYNGFIQLKSSYFNVSGLSHKYDIFSCENMGWNLVFLGGDIQASKLMSKDVEYMLLQLVGTSIIDYIRRRQLAMVILEN